MDGIGDKTADLFHGQAQLYRLMYLWMSSSCLKCATELEIPGIIHKHGKPISLSQLVSALKVPPSKATFVKELMRLLAHNGLFAIIKSNNNEEESEEVSYDLTSASKLLVSGTDHCLSPMVQLTINPTMINLYHHLGKWVRGKENTLRETSCGVGVFESLTQNPADLEAFQEAMASDSRFMKVALRDLESVFDGLSSIFGGGTGTTAKIICEAFPKLKCIVLDLPEVVASLSANSNMNFVSGNMLKSIPHADAILIKWVLHDWGDDDCIKILENAKEAISGNGKGGKVIIIDTVLNEKEDQHEVLETKLLINIMLAAECNSKERSEEEWKQIFMKAGFTDYQIFPIFGFRSLIVLHP